MYSLVRSQRATAHTLQNVSEVNSERSRLAVASSACDSSKHNGLVTKVFGRLPLNHVALAFEHQTLNCRNSGRLVFGYPLVNLHVKLQLMTYFQRNFFSGYNTQSLNHNQSPLTNTTRVSCSSR